MPSTQNPMVLITPLKPAMMPPAWEALLPDPLVLARQAEIEAGKLLEAARQAAVHGDWDVIRKMTSRLSSKAEALGSLAAEAAEPSFLRRRSAQGKAQFAQRPDDKKR